MAIRQWTRRQARSAHLALLALALATVPGAPRAASPSAVEVAETLRFSLPIRCEMGENCWLVNLVDLDPGPGRRDYLCGQSTYDGHKGTDIAIRDLGAMERGVAVLAAAEGRVKSLRDGMPDVDFTRPGAPSIKGRECGNGVVIDHGDGWQTQYCHLRLGSLAVNRGQRVARGQRLGLVGNSGRAQFPHVHLSVRRRGKIVDPFVGIKKRKDACGPGEIPLWRTEAMARLSRSTTALYNAGFATGAVDVGDARQGLLDARKLPATAPALVLWVDMFWVEAGDELRFRILAPDGRPFFDRAVAIDKTQARRFAFAGRKRKSLRWPAGAYAGEVTLTRDKGKAKERTFTARRRVELR